MRATTLRFAMSATSKPISPSTFWKKRLLSAERAGGLTEFENGMCPTTLCPALTSTMVTRFGFPMGERYIQRPSREAWVL